MKPTFGGLQGRVLVVEDDAELAALWEHVLRAAGFDVWIARTGAAGLASARQTRFDAVVSDIAMPEMDGVQLLERLRQIDALVPVLFLTGQAEVGTVQRAIELQAFRYLVKPVNLRALVASVRRAVSCCRWIRARLQAAVMVEQQQLEQPCEPDLAAHFNAGLDLLRVYYQPVVSVRQRRLQGFRVIARSLHPSFATFDALRAAADQLGRRRDLRRKLWALTAAPLEFLDKSLLLFVWTDLEGLADVTRYGVLAKHAPQTVLTVSDREGIQDGPGERQVLAELRSAGYRLSVDQLGDGYAGLNSLAWLEPEFLELEPGLVRHLGSQGERMPLLRALAGLAKELGAGVIAHGVVDESDASALAEIDCDLFSWDLTATPDELAPFSARTVAVVHP